MEGLQDQQREFQILLPSLQKDQIRHLPAEVLEIMVETQTLKATSNQLLGIKNQQQMTPKNTTPTEIMEQILHITTTIETTKVLNLLEEATNQTQATHDQIRIPKRITTKE